METDIAMELVANARNIIFDFDGVIADSEEFQLKIWEEITTERGLEIDCPHIEKIIGNSDLLAIENLCPGLSDTQYKELVQEKKKIYFERIDQIKLVPGSEPFIRSVSKTKKLFICSSSPRIAIKKILKKNLSMIHFDFIIGKGDYPYLKPQPSPYLTLIDRANIFAIDSLVIEDSNAGVSSSLSAGIKVIYLDRYGLRRHDVPFVDTLELLVGWRR